jgi:ketosteroid isomerase-like protein
MNTVTTAETNAIVDAEIRIAVDRFMSVFSKGDPVAIANTYTRDAVVAPPVGPIVNGTAGLIEFWKGVLNGPGMQLASYDVRDVQSLGIDVASEITEFVATIGGKRTEGKYLVVWKKVGGEWKLHLDAFNVAPN